MDWEYIKRYGYSAWQVIPLFFTTYLGMTLVFGGSAQIAWQKYNQHPEHHYNGTRAEHFRWWTESLALLVSGVCVLSVALVYSIIVCIIIPVMKKRKYRQHVHAPPEQDADSAEGVVQTWFAQSSSDIQEATELQETSSQHTMQYYSSAQEW